MRERHSLLARLLGHRRDVQNQSPRVSRRLRVETLEARIVLNGCYWTGNGITGNWSDSGNWVDGNGNPVVPGAGDAAIVDGMHGPNALNPITVDIPVTVGDFDMVSPVVMEVANNLTVSGKVTQYTGGITIDAGVTMTANVFDATSAIINGDGTLSIVGTPLMPGLFRFLSGQSSLDVATFSTDALSGLGISASVTIGSTSVTTNGPTLWDNGEVILGAGTTFTNNGRFTVSCDGIMRREGNAERFQNNGAFIKNAGNNLLIGTGITEIDPRFNNAGSVQVNSGTLDLNGPGRHNSLFLVDPGAFLVFDGAFQTLQSGTSFDGGGLVIVSDTTLTVAGASTDVVFSTPLRLMGAGNGGSLSGPGTVESWDSLDWQRGSVRDFDAYGTVTLSTNGVKTVNGTFNNYANFVYDGPGSLELNSGTFNNYNTFEIRNSVAIGDATAPNFPASSFNNLAGDDFYGIVTKTAAGFGPGTLFDVKFTNAGGLYLNGLDIQFVKDVIQSGGLAVTKLDGGTLSAGIPFDLQAGLLLGGGTIAGDINVGTAIVEVGSNPSNLVLTVTGSYYMGATSTLTIDASGANSWGQVNVGQTAYLAGTLQLQLLNGYTPPATGITVSVLFAGNLLNEFNTTPPGWTTSVDATLGIVTLSR